MSRSYKKTPISKDKNKDMKKHANKKVRKSGKNLSNGKSYRKVFPTYDVCDWTMRQTKEDFKSEIEETVLRANHEGKSYFLKGLEVNNSENIDFEDITLQELNEKINYNHWRKYFHSK